MRSMMGLITGLAAMLGMVLVSSSASAQLIHLSPFGQAAVEVYMGYRSTNESDVVVWKRKSNGQCRVFTTANGDNLVIGSPADDLMKVVTQIEAVSCSGTSSILLTPSVSDQVRFGMEGRGGNDTILAARPAYKADSGIGHDLIVVVDGWGGAQVFGGDGNDQIEAWGDSGPLMYGGAGDDCVWHPNAWEHAFLPLAFCGDGSNDKSNFENVHDCEQRVTCCPFGAFMGACTP